MDAGANGNSLEPKGIPPTVPGGEVKNGFLPITGCAAMTLLSDLIERKKSSRLSRGQAAEYLGVAPTSLAADATRRRLGGLSTELGAGSFMTCSNCRLGKKRNACKRR